VEHELYPKVVIPYRRIDDAAEGEERERETILTGEYTLWPLYKTLVQRPDLAKKVRVIDIFSNDDTIRIEANLSSAFPGSIPLSSDILFEINEIILVACSPIKRIPDPIVLVKATCIHLSYRPDIEGSNEMCFVPSASASPAYSSISFSAALRPFALHTACYPPTRKACLDCVSR
jgi:hypothetical protein